MIAGLCVNNWLIIRLITIRLKRVVKEEAEFKNRLDVKNRIRKTIFTYYIENK